MIKTITSLKHPLVKHLVKLQQDRSYRLEEKKVVIEGKKMIQEIGCSHPLEVLCTVDPSLISPSAKETYVITPEICKKISLLETPEGVIALVAMPPFSSLKHCERIVALDGVSDPGNLGTLIRTALAFGWSGVFLLENCCDPFNDKALRSAKGATFHLDIDKGNIEKLKQLASETNALLIAADIEGKTTIQTFENESLILILGSESLGIREEIKKSAQRITLPISSKCDSLNVAVAGGILMHIYQKK